MASTSAFGWETPDDTDLVKDGAAAIRTLGNSIDTSMADLKGGTSGQVLSKASNTDMDFNWVTTDDANAIQNAIVDAKGDLIAASAADTPARLAVGTNGQVLTADSTAATGLAWATPSAAGASVNLLLNSNFALNQRSYVSAANLASGSYGFDRWKSNFTNTTLTFTASTQGQSITINSGGGLQQVIEQGLVPSGTYTLSWTGTATARVYNSGGTPPSYAASPVTFTADGTANVVVEFTASGSTKTLSKVQFNAGTNTTWSLATPTLQSELAACQRYYVRHTAGSSYTTYGAGLCRATDSVHAAIQHPVQMRVAPTSVDFSTIAVLSSTGSVIAATALVLDYAGTQNSFITVSVASGLTIGNATLVVANGSTSAYIAFNAEL